MTYCTERVEYGCIIGGAHTSLKVPDQLHARLQAATWRTESTLGALKSSWLGMQGSRIVRM